MIPPLMENSMFNFPGFDFEEIQGGGYNDTPLLGNQEAAMKGKEGPLFSVEDLGQVYPLCPDYGPYKGLEFMEDDHQQPIPQEQQQMSTKSNYTMLEEFFGSCFPAPTVPMQEVKRTESSIQPGPRQQQAGLSSSLELLNNYASGVKKLNLNVNQSGYSLNGETGTGSGGSGKKLSTEEVMRVAGARYVQFSDQSYDDFLMLKHPFGYALSGLSEEETRDVELAHLLLAAAEKVGYQQYDRASRLLTRCEWIASERSNPVQRVVYYFAEALRERIDKATGRFNPKEVQANRAGPEILHGLGTNLTNINLHQKIPISQVWQLTSIQTIIENVGSAKKLHMIDFEIRSGVQWTSLMQALQDRERPLEQLKVTAVGIRGNHQIEETGKRLESFAKSMNFPFAFKAAYVPSLNEIKEGQIETSSDECVIVVCNMILRTMLCRPECLESVMRSIKSLNPTLMLLAETEANINSPNFFSRFIEALFFFSAYFDCLETCLNKDVVTKTNAEATFAHGIRDMVVLEGPERESRNVKMDVWRAFFSRFRMLEIAISESSLYQASLVVKQFPCWRSCTLEKNGKCLFVGWKGTPLSSLSAWKFSRERIGRSFVNHRS